MIGSTYRKLQKRPILAIISFVVLAAVGFLAGFYLYAGTYGFNVVFRRGGSIWVSVEPNDPQLSAAIRLALRETSSHIEVGQFEWRTIDNGFDVAELPAMAEDLEVDRILLARISPTRFRFQVRVAQAGDRELSDWMTDLGAALVINGSYYSRYGTPDTPVVSDSIPLGPRDYDARHGAFVASKVFVGIRDLSKKSWHEELRDAENAMVSYPLLITADGSMRVSADRRWLANRSFVGQDHSGRIVLGTTTNAYFSLDRFAEFLRKAPLELTMALNLDGGPVACQGIALNSYRRDFCGNWELAVRDGELKLLKPVIGTRRWGLPIVLAVFPK